MAKRSIREMDLKGKRVLTRVDFNVPLEGGTISDDTRIRAALPTIRHILDAGGRAVLMSHLGRPKGKVVPAMRLRPAAERLAELLDRDVAMADDCVGDGAAAVSGGLSDGQACLLENLRFHKGETDNDAAFAQSLAANGDCYVNDAFGTAHRAHASTVGVIAHLSPCGAGFLMAQEIESFGKILDSPARPFVAVLGGAKVSDKISVIENLLDQVDALLIGGAMAHTFQRAQGHATGASLVEEDKLDVARDLIDKAEKKGVALLLPADHVTADAFAADAHTALQATGGIADGWQGLDIGPETRSVFAAKLKEARTVIWNGPMGVFEMKPFAAGTFAVANAIAESGAHSVVGGGDSVAAVNRSGVAGRISHISTGGGASLELLEGKTLPGLAALDDA